MASLNSRVAAVIERRRVQRADDLSVRRSEIYARFPRIREIEQALDATGLRLINSVADGSREPDSAAAEIMAQNRAANAEKREILIANGYPPDFLDDAPLCEKCSDTGYSGGEVCGCVRAELNKTLLAEANLSDRLSAQTFEAFRFDYYSSEPDAAIGVSPRENMKSVYTVCRRFADTFPAEARNFFFSGGCGLGKTFLSSAIANRLIEKGADVLYVSANSLFPVLEDLHFNRSVSEKNRYLVSHVFDCELLILDDLGAEFITQFTSAELFRIINDRLLSERSTVISTNLSLDELKTKYSERIHSRISGGYDIIPFFGGDIRKLKKGIKKGI